MEECDGMPLWHEYEKRIHRKRIETLLLNLLFTILRDRPLSFSLFLLPEFNERVV